MTISGITRNDSLKDHAVWKMAEIKKESIPKHFRSWRRLMPIIITVIPPQKMQDSA